MQLVTLVSLMPFQNSCRKPKRWTLHIVSAKSLMLMAGFFLAGLDNTQLYSECHDLPPITNLGYLPVIDASPTYMDIVYTILKQSINIADELELGSIALVMDQAIYAKAQQICWENDSFKDRLVVRLGDFHTAVA